MNTATNKTSRFDVTTIAGLNAMLDATQPAREAARTLDRFRPWAASGAGATRDIKPVTKGHGPTIVGRAEVSGAYTVCLPSGRASRGNAGSFEAAQAAVDALLVKHYVGSVRPKG